MTHETARVRAAPGPRAASKARTRENLLAAAAEVFAERGYGAASVEEIARRAGVSVGSVYAHFESKQKLFVALMDANRVNEIETAEKVLTEGFDAARDLLAAQLARTADDERAALLGAEAWLFAVRSPSFGADLSDHNDRLRGDIARLVRGERERRGVSWRLSDDEVASVVLGMFTGLVQHRRLSPASVPDDLYGRTLAVLLDGLEIRDPG